MEAEYTPLAAGLGSFGPSVFLSGQGRDRTADTVIFSHVLYQLIYLAVGATNISGLD